VGAIEIQSSREPEVEKLHSHRDSLPSLSCLDTGLLASPFWLYFTTSLSQALSKALFQQKSYTYLMVKQACISWNLFCPDAPLPISLYKEQTLLKGITLEGAKAESDPQLDALSKDHFTPCIRPTGAKFRTGRQRSSLVGARGIGFV